MTRTATWRVPLVAGVALLLIAYGLFYGKSNTLYDLSARTDAPIETAKTFPVSNASIDVCTNQTKLAATNTFREKDINKIIIYAKYRTGSTFTSEFFFKHQGIAYMFEPLRLLWDPNEVGIQDAAPILKDMLDCHFRAPSTQVIMDWWMDRTVFCQVTGQFPNCIHGRVYPIEAAEQHCQKSQHRVTKLIRISKLIELQEFFRQGVKVVHVVRDPRGIMSSRLKIHGHHHYWGQIASRSMEYCHGGAEDIKYIQRQFVIDKALVQRLYYFVRYEDLAADPKGEMTRLYAFLNIKPDRRLREWVQSVARASGENLGTDTIKESKPKSQQYMFGTQRSNPKETSTAWRYSLNINDTQVVQHMCKEFMEMAGYLNVENESALRNSDVPLFKDIDKDELFFPHRHDISDNNWELVRIMAWRRSGDKPLSGPMRWGNPVYHRASHGCHGVSSHRQPPHCGPLGRENHQWPVDSLNKRPATWKAFSCQNVIMYGCLSNRPRSPFHERFCHRNSKSMDI